MGYPPIESHGIIGDLHTVALVGIDGAIDFLCFPHFDSPSVFASLLDDKRGGRFQIAPILADARHRQLYLPDSNVLLTRFYSSAGVAELSDFMPVSEPGGTQAIVRRAKTVRGEIRFRLTCSPRFDYGRAQHRVERREGEVLFVSQGQDGLALRLRAEIPLQVENGDACCEFQLRAGQSAFFVLEQASAGAQAASAERDYVSLSFKETTNFWRRWIGRSTYRGRWREMVNRSALTLKLLVSAPHGSIVAAPTFGLPEHIGGERNWDYRYTWIRDATFTLYALMRLGFTEEAGAFLRWIEARCGELSDGGSLQVLYGIDGRRQVDEETLAHLEGYRRAAPVRIGNGAYCQLQLDIYGELMDAVYLYDKYASQISYDLWRNLVRLIDWTCSNWEQPDEGIWEIRNGRREFLYSRVMCWVAIDRGVRLARKRALPAPLERWEAERDRVYRDVLENFWDGERRTFVQHKGARTVDAASLLMPLVKFIGPRDPRWLGTLAAIEERLVEDSLVYRYDTARFADGLRGGEGTFTPCTFWYVEALSRAGDLRKARFVFEKALGYANHLGLYGEELGPSAEHMGNFPQALSHLALISTAYDLDRRLSAAPEDDI